jgi:3-methyladenine DNA glycosylase AlkD
MATQATAQAFLARLEALGSPVEQDKLRRYFQAGEGPDRTADMVLGVRMADVFALAKEFVDLPPGEIDQLLASPIHEARAGGLSIMGKQASRKQTPERRRKELYELYLRRTERINDWDLVDISAHQVVGGYLLDKPRDVLYELARSPRWWERRVAMFATLAFVRRGDLDDTFTLAEILVYDEHDLVQKVVGGMLREAGKHDRARLLRFLDTHAAAAPRVLLRYAIEHLDPEQRAHYLSVQPRGGPRGVRQASG